MKKTVIVLGLCSVIFSCSKQGIEDVQPILANVTTPTNSSARVAAGTIKDYSLTLNSSGYASEFFIEKDSKGKDAVFGSCFAASVALVEANIDNSYCIATNGVKLKNDAMKGQTKPTGDYYILSLDAIKSQLTKDGFKNSSVGGDITRTSARDVLIKSLSNKRWIIALSGYLGGGIGHAYVIHKISVYKDTNGNIDESKSTVYLMDSFAGGKKAFDGKLPANFYTSTSLSTFLDRMKTNTKKEEVYKFYNIVEVYK
jgi:hypothetical protein